MLALPVVVLVTVSSSVVTAVPEVETSAPWRSEKLTLGLVPPLSTASKRLIVRACGARSRMRLSLTCGLSSLATCGGIGPGGPSSEAN